MSQSALADEVITNALKFGNALLKFITPNNVGETGSHECGFYLPKSIHGIYTPHGPDKGQNYNHAVEIIWQNGLRTNSVVKWYGRKTRSEYRLTSFGRDFPFLAPEMVGSVLVLIAIKINSFFGYVLQTDDDIQTVRDALSLEMTDSWAFYNEAEIGLEIEDVSQCIERLIREFSETIVSMPSGQEMSQNTQRILQTCDKSFIKAVIDRRLLDCVHTEYELFKFVERKIWTPAVREQFQSIDGFLRVAQSILQSRKSRAGRALENHAAFVFQQEGLPFHAQPNIPGRPDMIFPNTESYYDNTSNAIVLGIKTTCKDRWRQILNEAPAISKKYILTLQPSISYAQLEEMHKADVSLVVPKSLQKNYPGNTPIELLTVNDFVGRVTEKMHL